MTRSPSPATRTTLYRLDDVPELSQAIRDKYLNGDGFESTPTIVGGREAMLVCGSMTTERVAWATTVHALTSLQVELGNVTAASALIIRRSDDAAWALTYGMGFQLLDQAKVDGGFGQRIAIRVADPNDLSSITRTTLDQRSRTDRLSIPSGDHLRGFGVGDFGELVTRLVGKAEIPSLTGGEKPIRIRGADALSVPLGKHPNQLVADIDVLEAMLARPAAPELEVLEQLVAVKNAPDVVDELDRALDAALADPSNARLGLSWPHERIDENSTPSSFRLTRPGLRSPEASDGIPELGDLLAVLGDGHDLLARLKSTKVHLYRDAAGTEAISAAIPALRWLVFEIVKDGKRYCLYDGRWYLMDRATPRSCACRLRRSSSDGPRFSFLIGRRATTRPRTTQPRRRSSVARCSTGGSYGPVSTPEASRPATSSTPPGLSSTSRTSTGPPRRAT
ncbi:MAG: TIGR04141 family sporadically distributed protein [Actinomycetia bacterium]|nr:TIGR04141 family sporadically distributed protein [Actinomycetes bacterium]